ncbi:MAG TPA: porphobilinogen synthase [Limnochordia bacterium]
MGFPIHRPRRLRRTDGLRRLVRETELSTSDLVWPLFVVAGEGVEAEIEALPGNYHMSPDRAAQAAARAGELGVPAVLLFGLPPYKDEDGSSAWRDDGPVQTAVRAIKEAAPQLVVITDVCLCEYTSHGHCGHVEGGEVDNDRTLELLAEVAVSHAQAGADVVAPSDMMDGRVGRLRAALDEAGYSQVAILSYAAKYASCFYEPFRDAAGSAMQFGDRRGYQMDPANGTEALREVALDIEEGADMVMVKPALGYLDIVWRVKEAFGVPLAAYQVSGEAAMIKAAAAAGRLDERRAVLETLTSIKRAGADFIVTYFAPEVARWIGGAA